MQSDAFGDVPAVLDTSFWNVAFGVRVEVYLPRFFRLLVPSAVAGEIQSAGAAASAEGFRLWRKASLLRPEDPIGGWPVGWGPAQFAGQGERDALLLSQEREAVALINEGPAKRFAAARGLLVLDVPAFVALAVGNRVMRWPAGWAALDPAGGRQSRCGGPHQRGSRAADDPVLQGGALMATTTKSVRLDPEETQALADLAGRLGCSEAALLRRWALEGIRETRIDLAILEFTKGRASPEQAALTSGLERHLFEAELLRRGIFGPGTLEESPRDWLRDLGRVATKLGSPALRAAVEQALERTQARDEAAAAAAPESLRLAQAGKPLPQRANLQSDSAT